MSRRAKKLNRTINQNEDQKLDVFQSDSLLNINEQMRNFNRRMENMMKDFGLGRMNFNASFVPETENILKVFPQSKFNPETENFLKEIPQSLTKPPSVKKYDKMFKEFEHEPVQKIPGKYISQSYFSSNMIGKDGKEHSEDYHSQSISNIQESGKRISERQQAYKNSLGEEKMALEKTLDDKGVKSVKARKRESRESYEHNYYKGINEEQIDKFNKDYTDQKKKVKFDDNYKMLGSLSSRKNMLGQKKNQLFLEEPKLSFNKKL